MTIADKGTPTIDIDNLIPASTADNLDNNENLDNQEDIVLDEEGNEIITEGEEDIQDNEEGDDKGEEDEGDGKFDENGNEIIDETNKDDEQIQKLMSRYKTTEDLAKAKLESDRAYTKSKQESAVKSIFIENASLERDAKLIDDDYGLLVKIAKEDPEYANKLTQKKFDMSYDEFELWLIDKQEELIKQQVEESETKTLSYEEAEQLAELKARKLFLQRSSESSKTSFTQLVNTTVLDYLKENGVDVKSQAGEARQVLELYNDIADGKKIKTAEDIKKYMKVALNNYKLENIEFNNTIKIRLDKLGKSAVPSNQSKKTIVTEVPDWLVKLEETSKHPRSLLLKMDFVQERLKAERVAKAKK